MVKTVVQWMLRMGCGSIESLLFFRISFCNFVKIDIFVVLLTTILYWGSECTSSNAFRQSNWWYLNKSQTKKKDFNEEKKKNVYSCEHTFYDNLAMVWDLNAIWNLTIPKTWRIKHLMPSFRHFITFWTIAFLYYVQIFSSIGFEFVSESYLSAYVWVDCLHILHVQCTKVYVHL